MDGSLLLAGIEGLERKGGCKMSTSLDKMRKINRLIHRSENMEYSEICQCLGNVLDAEIYLIDVKGEFLGYANQDNQVLSEGSESHFAPQYVKKLGKIDETHVGKTLPKEQAGDQNPFHGKNAAIVPIYGAGKRIGTLVVVKGDSEINDDDILLSEYASVVMGLRIYSAFADQARLISHKKAAITVAFETLSLSEKEAMIRVFKSLDPTSNMLVASSVAETEPKITRSVVVNALRKLESAGVIKSTSMGMKGTHIEILNDCFMEELEKLSKTFTFVSGSKKED